MFEASIQKSDGSSSPIRIHAIPHVGDSVRLFSQTEQNGRMYQVVHVEHMIEDVSARLYDREGRHSITIHVKPLENR